MHGTNYQTTKTPAARIQSLPQKIMREVLILCRRRRYVSFHLLSFSNFADSERLVMFPNLDRCYNPSPHVAESHQYPAHNISPCDMRCVSGNLSLLLLLLSLLITILCCSLSIISSGVVLH
ncbi:hypothetical protein KC19_9G132500 [Ceratodon purpureus]|uniref:Uncharacterized protein n=1 Tax=Ceratodon purpureus TaxID=3225 RepID=A0A8T0GTM9_CERPU|nr:hypothetical protein KC19_9G132500 [Ceratodon purpureus]